MGASCVPFVWDLRLLLSSVDLVSANFGLSSARLVRCDGEKAFSKRHLRGDVLCDVRDLYPEVSHERAASPAPDQLYRFDRDSGQEHGHGCARPDGVGSYPAGVVAQSAPPRFSRLAA